MSAVAVASDRQRVRVEIRGAVQGVGFRPFVFRLAEELAVDGWVVNDTVGVFVEAEGARARLESFVARLRDEAPPRAVVHELAAVWLEPVGIAGFTIRESDGKGARTVVVLPDVVTCPACLTEILDRGDRRHGYPFTNCTDCGPRFTIVEALPYDRPNTTMAGFALCPTCRAEYENPRDRRFHAQPTACPNCGPAARLLAAGGAPIAAGPEAIAGAAAALRAGGIVGLKGLGGYQLLVDARDEAAVNRLRERKAREEKPFALMVRDLDAARAIARVDEAAAVALTSAAGPIVLLERVGEAAVAPAVAPGNPRLGVMLPTTPLHHLLLRELDRPVVATSGNLSDEPIVTDDGDAVARLGEVADLFLAHDRPIARQADDSVVAIIGGEGRLVRRARGFAPLPIVAPHPLPTLLAVGAHLKNTMALALDRQVFVSQHLGDMETPGSIAAFERVARDFLDLYGASPAAVAHDLHPEYATTRWAAEATASGSAWNELASLPRVPVQHHHAHLAACLADNGVDGPALGVTWDGTGFGPDGTVWGGEWLLGDATDFRRVARFRPFRLPGGDAAVREPRRVALALLWELAEEEALHWEALPAVRALAAVERDLLRRMLRTGLRSPWTSSAGRLFDGVASLAGLRQRVSFEGQAAMELEWAAVDGEIGAYRFDLLDAPADGPWAPAIEVDWRPAVEGVAGDVLRGVPASTVAARFHRGLVEVVAAVAERVGASRVALTGGCFQNRRLVEGCRDRLAAAGFAPLIHRQVPPNDGGISLGQTMVAAARLAAGLVPAIDPIAVETKPCA